MVSFVYFLYNFTNFPYIEGQPVLLKEKLLCITDHMCNKHVFEDNLEYKRCPHDDLGEDREKPWLDPESLVWLIYSLYCSIYISIII